MEAAASQDNAASSTRTQSAHGSDARFAQTETSQAPAASQNKQDWKAQKEQQALLRKQENDLKKCEDRIAKLEERNSWIDSEMSKPEIATNSVKLQELAAEQAKNNEELDILFVKWEELAELVNTP